MGSVSLSAADRRRLLLLKPMTFMNLQRAESVQAAMAFYQLQPA